MSGCRINLSLKDLYKTCVSCGRTFKPQYVLRRSATLQQYGFETPCDVCSDCHVGQSLLTGLAVIVEMLDLEVYERTARVEAYGIVKGALDAESTADRNNNNNNNNNNNDSDNDSSSVNTNGFVMVETRRVSDICKSDPMLATLASRSRHLRDLMEELANPECCMSDADFLSQLMPCELMIKSPSSIAEDMVTAIKLLHLHTLPESPTTVRDLQTVLEYFLDLCKEKSGLEILSLFWGQIMQIHLAMLPVVDVDKFIRTDILEDFLITVSTKFSMQLGLELVWFLTANLNWGGACTLLDSHIIRFLVELESSFQGEPWGLGGNSLQHRFRPSYHQEILVKNLLKTLRDQRGHLNMYLSTSVRRDIAMKCERGAGRDKGLRDQKMQPIPPPPPQEQKQTKSDGAIAASGSNSNSDSNSEEGDGDKDSHSNGSGIDNEEDDDDSGGNDDDVNNESDSDNDKDEDEDEDMGSDDCTAKTLPDSVSDQSYVSKSVDMFEYFKGQLRIMRELGSASGECFKIDPPERSEFLQANLERINKLIRSPPSSAANPSDDRALVCGSPLTVAGDELQNIVNFVEGEGRVFRSKARTPILVYMEIGEKKVFPCVCVPSRSCVVTLLLSLFCLSFSFSLCLFFDDSNQGSIVFEFARSFSPSGLLSRSLPDHPL